MAWTEEKIERVRKLMGYMCAREIALELGVTKNAIIGICHRQEIPFLKHRKPAGRVPTVENKQNGPLSINYERPAALRRGIIPTTHSKPLLEEQSLAKDPCVWALGGCVYIIGEPKHLKGCGRPVWREGASYCLQHYRNFIGKGDNHV